MEKDNKKPAKMLDTKDDKNSEHALDKLRARKRLYESQMRKLQNRKPSDKPKKLSKEFIYKIRRLNERGKPDLALIHSIPYLTFDPCSIESMAGHNQTDLSKEMLLLEICESWRILEEKCLPFQADKKSKADYPHTQKSIVQLAWNILYGVNSYSYRATYLLLTSSFKHGDKELLKKALEVGAAYLDRFPQEFTIRLWMGHIHVKMHRFEDAAIEYATAEQSLEKDYFYFLPRGNIWKRDGVFNPLVKISLKGRIVEKLYYMLECLQAECTNTSGQIVNYEKYSDCLSIVNALQKYAGFEAASLKECELLIRTNQYHEAQDILEFLLNHDPKYHEAIAAVAQSYLEQGDYKKALECIKKAEYYDKKNMRYQDIEDQIIREGLYALERED